jgi:hypothetical protein
MTSLSTSQINVRKFKYQKLSSKDDVKKLKTKLIDMVSDYLDGLLEDFAIKEKEITKLQKKLKSTEFLDKVCHSYNSAKKKKKS